MCTDAAEGVLQLQGEGGEGDVIRDGQDGDSGEVGGRVPRVPLAGGGVETQTTCWENKRNPFDWFSFLSTLLLVRPISRNTTS